MGKAKPTKHTSAELKKKTFEATCNRGGGASGIEDRKGGKAGHAKFKCPICGQQAPDLKSMQIHHDARHPKLPFDAAKCEDLHEVFGGTTQGIAIRGSVKEKHG